MPQYDNKRMAALYHLFRVSALEDQRTYYKRTVARHRKAASQVNWYRAMFAFLTGFASALAGLLVAYSLNNGTLKDCKTQLAVLPEQIAAIQAETTAEATTEPTLTPTLIPTSTPTPQTVTSGAAPTEEAAASNCGISNILVPFLLVVAVVAPALGGAFTTLADLYQWDRLITIYDTAIENLEVADAQSPLDAMPDLDYRASLRAYAEGTLTVMRDETAQWGQLIKTPAALEKFIAEEQAKANKANPNLGGENNETP